MNDLFATAMGRALEHTRAGDPLSATRLIQEALGGEAGAESGRLRRKHQPRLPLGEVVDRLARSGRFAPGPRRSNGGAPPDVPVGARYAMRRHECLHGGRDYRIFTPSPRQETVQGLVLMLHGCTQTVDDFATGTRMNDHAERENLVMIYPQQPRSANQAGCWNWFRPEDQSAERGEPALLAGLARSVAAEFDLKPERIFAAGLSAGGAMAAILGAEHRGTFAAVGVHSGLAPGAAHDVPSAFSAMQGRAATRRPTPGAPVRCIVFHGDADATVAPRNADAVIAAAIGAAKTAEVQDRSTAGALCTIHLDDQGRSLAENWRVRGAPHAWSGGAPAGSYTHPTGPDASAEMVRFFLSTSPEGRT